MECLLCVQQVSIIGLGQCNHKAFCHICIIKMRTISKSKTCPVCKQDLPKVILTEKLDANYNDFDTKDLPSLKVSKDLLYDSEEVRKTVESLSQVLCIVPDCKQANTIFPNLKTLQQHLKNEHHLQLCETCLENKTCVLREQTLYSEYDHRRHLNHGDVDEDGNIIFFHPFCKYCCKFFYDEDKFKLHLNQAHINCNLCHDQKYKYYRDHASFERHLKFSHYMCEDPQCRDTMMVFQTSHELETHTIKVHSNDPRIKKLYNQKTLQLTGFYDDGQTQKQTTHHDNEGFDFIDQFISLQKTKMRAIGEIDVHHDEVIYLRDIITHDYNDPLDRKLDMSERELHQKNVNLEDLHLYKMVNFPAFTFDTFLKKCLRFCHDEEKLRKILREVENEKIPPRQFVISFIDIFGMKTGSRLLQFFIGSKDMRDGRLKQIALKIEEILFEEVEKLPRLKNTLIMSSKKYSELFKNILNQLNENLKTRITEGKLVNYNDTCLEREKIVQLIQILRHVKTQEMGKLKFAPNFGLSTNTLNYIKSQILNEDLKFVQQNLSTISNQEFMPFYFYIDHCQKMLSGLYMHQDKSQINKCIYHEFLSKHENLKQMLKIKYEDQDEAPKPLTQVQSQKKSKQSVASHQAQVQILQQQQEKQEQKQKKAPPPPQSAGLNFNPYEFPLPQGVSQPKVSQPKQNTSWNDGHLLLVEATRKVKDEQFPTLDAVLQKPQQPKKQKQQQPQVQTYGFQMDDSFVPLVEPKKEVVPLNETDWTAPNLKKEKDLVELGRKVKKGKTKVMITGGFF